MPAPVFGSMLIDVNIYLGKPALAAVEAGMSVYAGTLLVVIRQGFGSLRVWILAYLLPFFAVTMYALGTQVNDQTVFVWVLLIPVLSHLLLGRWEGMAVGGTFMLCAGMIFFLRFGGTVGSSQIEAASNIVLCSLCIFGLSHVHEVSRTRAERILRRMALADPLTGIANRRRFQQAFAYELANYRRERTPTVLLMLDMDNFKQVNDRYGHDAGDAVLIFVGGLLKAQVRSRDIVARLGGEEFGLLLCATPVDEARAVAENLRRVLNDTPCRYLAIDIPLSASFGMASLGLDGDDFQQVFAAADHQLYRAKAAGRNRIEGLSGGPERQGANRSPWLKMVCSERNRDLCRSRIRALARIDSKSSPSTTMLRATGANRPTSLASASASASAHTKMTVD